MAQRTIILVLFCTIINSLCILSEPSAIATPVDDFFNIMQEFDSVMEAKGKTRYQKGSTSISLSKETGTPSQINNHRSIYGKSRKKGKLIDTGRCSIP